MKTMSLKEFIQTNDFESDLIMFRFLVGVFYFFTLIIVSSYTGLFS